MTNPGVKKTRYKASVRSIVITHGSRCDSTPHNCARSMHDQIIFVVEAKEEEEH